MQYVPRIVDAEIQTKLAAIGAVLIEGPKACGKTETARQLAKSEVLLDVNASARQAASVDASLILEGATPRLIDEWQIEPEIWNAVRRAVDARGPGQFLLTGSAVPMDDATRHVGAGRVARIQMRPMSLFESGESSGTVSLRSAIEGSPVAASDPGIAIRDLADLVSRGGWPGMRLLTVAQAVDAIRGYLDEIQRVDIRRIDGTRRNPTVVGRLLRSLARNVATHASDATIAQDVRGERGPVKSETIAAYVDALRRLMIVEDQPAWAPELRSRSRLRVGARRHFVDPSIAVAALRSQPGRLLDDLPLLGFLFESLVVRDLRIYAQALDGQVLHYRDNTDLEVDAIVELANGRWAAFEVKLGVRQVDEAAKNLLLLADRVDTAVSGPPAALGVIVGTGLAYMREDGVAVIPIGTLGP